TLRQAPPGVVEENRFRVRETSMFWASRQILQQQALTHRPVCFQRFVRFRTVRNDPLLVALAANAQDAVFAIHVHEIEAGEFADAKACGVEQLKDGAVTLDEYSFFVGVASRKFPFGLVGTILGRILRAGFEFHSCDLVEETVHLLGGEYGWNALGELRRRHETRGIFFQYAFPHAVFEKRTKRGELSRDGAFFE